MDHYQVLGVPRTVDRTALHKAFRDLSKKNHPDRFPESQRTQAEKKYQTICIAFNTLKDPKLRSAYDRKLNSGRPLNPRRQVEDPQQAAKKYFDLGKQKLQERQFAQAIDMFKRANHYRPDPEGFFHQALAESEIKNNFKGAVANFQKAISMRPKVLKYHIQYIEALRRFGLNVRARTALDDAFGHFPQSEELLEIGKVLDPKKYGKGFLGGLFKR